eukprot:14262140-Alexandrium_andersonii.AAC.2
MQVLLTVSRACPRGCHLPDPPPCSPTRATTSRKPPTGASGAPEVTGPGVRGGGNACWGEQWGPGGRQPPGQAQESAGVTGTRSLLPM